MTGASDDSDGEGAAVGDPSVGCLFIVSWSMVLAALGAIVSLALLLRLLGMTSSTFFTAWFIGAPIAAAAAAMGVLFLQLNPDGDPRRPH